MRLPVYMFSLLYQFCGLDQIMLMYRMKDQQRNVMIGTTLESLEVSKTRMMMTFSLAISSIPADVSVLILIFIKSATVCWVNVVLERQC